MLKYKKKIAEILSYIKTFLKDNDIEVCAFMGVFPCLIATYIISFVAFLYAFGGIFILLAVFLYNHPQN